MVGMSHKEELITTKPWGAENWRRSEDIFFHKDDGVRFRRFFLGWDTTGAMSFSHLAICSAYFPVIFLEDVLEEVGACPRGSHRSQMQVEVPKPPKCLSSRCFR